MGAAAKPPASSATEDLRSGIEITRVTLELFERELEVLH